MKIVSMTCPNCGAKLKVNSEIKNITCNYCGNALYLDDEVTHIQFDNSEQAGYEFEKGRQRAQAEQRRTAQTYPAQPVYEKKKKKNVFKIILWVLGWIYLFPLPVTILVLRKQSMKKSIQIAIIVGAWVLYFIIIAISAAISNSEQLENSEVALVLSNIVG